MANFYIKRVRAFGSGMSDAVVDFTDGLNIICGISDTGKTCVQMSIDYIFGGSDLPFDKDETGYTEIEVVIETKKGEIRLYRQLGRNIITVTSEDAKDFEGKYDTNHRKTSKNKDIDMLFLRLIGIEDEITLIRSKDFVRSRLTWRSFLHIFLIKEDDVDRRESILLPRRAESNTLFFSALIYLLTEEDFSNYDAQEEKRIRDAKKNEIVAHIKAELRDLADRKDELESKLLDFGDIELNSKVHGIIAEVTAIRKRIDDANERGKGLLHGIMVAREEMVNCDIMLDRHGSLRKHYIADIKRLTLIVDGESVLADAPILEKCPYCDGDMEEIEQENYAEAARHELARIIEQLKGLGEVEAVVASRKAEIESRIKTLDEEKTDIDEIINEQLRPAEIELTTILADYEAAMRIKGELDFIERFTGERLGELRDKEETGELKLEYRPKGHFDSKFRETIDKYLDEIFKKCLFENFNAAHLDVDGKFDVSINGANKATTRGQGYRAYINTVLALTFRKYLKDHGKYYPGIFSVDSPLQTLKQGVDEQAPESMKTALFRYLLETQEYGQVIVIENEIPALDYESYGVTPIRFTGGKSPGRYGFLKLKGQ